MASARQHFPQRTRPAAAVTAVSPPHRIPSFRRSSEGMRRHTRQMRISMNAYPTSSNESIHVEAGSKKSEIYSDNMTQAMGAALTYRHEVGMNYDFIRPDMIVGSCLQTPNDVDKLLKIGVKTIFCLQKDSDLQYFGVDINAIQEYAKKCSGIEHCRAEIRDFDAFDLRIRLPAVVSKLHKTINCNGGITYIHCTAGLGRAPAVALAYMFWIQGYKLCEAHSLLTSKRPSFPSLEAIKRATIDIFTGLTKQHVALTWEDNRFESVEVSGLDVGWGQRLPLTFDKEKGLWILERDLLEGRYEYKYIIDGEWACNKYELTTSPNGNGHVNNYINVCNQASSAETSELQKRLMDDDVDLTMAERQTIRDSLETCSAE